MARVARGEAKGLLLDAATHLVRAHGYAGTSVDELCARAGVTKGAFFHHFESKEALAIAAARRFAERLEEILDRVEARLGADRSTPRARVLAYVDARIALLEGPLAERTCLLGTLAQEIYASHAAIREACAEGMQGHLERLRKDLRAALAAGAQPAADVDRGLDAETLALHILAVVQGGFVVAKALDDPAAAVAGLRHLARYLEHVLPLNPEPECPP
jgi:TetR/AcrR family transcriptional repressor of nem operon